ncbi:MAG: hypothetical protein WC421_05675 [Elusimicrobiales bacterium]
MIDAHVHIERGPYTLDWLKRFISTAISRKITEIHFLEHSFRFTEFKDIYNEAIAHPRYGNRQKDWLEKRATLSLSDYQRLILKTRQEVFPVKVMFGLEVCYFPGMETQIKAALCGFNWDFMTGAIHWINGWGFDHKESVAEWKLVDVNAVYRDYYNEMMLLVKSGIFTHLAHPDSIKCFKYHPSENFSETYTMLASKLAKNGMYAEISGGLKLNYGLDAIGPCQGLLSSFAAHHVKLIAASDAHKPEDVGCYILEAENIIKNCQTK